MAVFAGAIGMQGIPVMNILPQSQADAYGLQIGDVIERVGGEDPLLFETPSSLIAQSRTDGRVNR